MRRFVRAWVLVATSVGLAAAIASPAPANAAPGGGPSDSIAWRPCTADEIPAGEDFLARMQCAYVKVPADYERPDGRTISLFVSRRAAVAPDSLGPLFVNQGGPGMEAAIFATSLGGFTALDRFDIIGMDPRGTGRSTKLECKVDIGKLPTLDVDDTGHLDRTSRQALDHFVDGCAGDANLPRFGSNTVARDMDRIRELLGAPQLSYFGKSYGSDLGTAYLSLFPDRVRAAVLDGASDLTLGAVDFVTQQARASQRAFDRYLAHCRVDECAWTEGDDPATAWDQLLRRLASEPVRDAESAERVDDARLRDFQHEAWQLDDESIDAAIDALVLGNDPSAFVAPPLDDETAQVAQAFFATTCLDLPVDDFAAAFGRLRDAVGEPNPDLVSELAMCSRWPGPRDPIQVRQLTPGAPVMVVSTRGDVPTPYESGTGLAGALGVPVLTWEANAHTGYIFSECVRQLANRLLVDLQNLPADGATCPDDRPTQAAGERIDDIEPDLAEL